MLLQLIDLPFYASFIDVIQFSNCSNLVRFERRLLRRRDGPIDADLDPSGLHAFWSGFEQFAPTLSPRRG